MRASDEILERAGRIRLVAMDVDGVLTDGRYFHFPDVDGKLVETKGFDSQDGIALSWLHQHGIESGVISGRTSPATAERARQSKMKYVYQGHTEKIPILEEILKDSKLKPEQVGYIGDDLTDVVIMHRVGFGVATANARPEVKREARYTTKAAGGFGAVREVVEMILQAKGLWAKVLDHYEIRA